MKRTKRTLCILVLLLALRLDGAMAQAPGPAPGVPTIDPGVVDSLQREGLRLNFEDIDIKVLARIIAQVTGRNIVLDQKVQGKVTLVSAETVTPDQAWDMFVSALEAYGFGVVPDQGFYQVTPIAQARTSQARIYPNKKARVLVAIIRLNRTQADQIVNMLRPLLSPTGSISGAAATNTILVADEANIVRRVVALAKKLDNSATEPVMRIYYPRRVRAADVAKNLEALVPDRQSSRITVHQPTNSLIVVGPPRTQAIVERLLNSLERRDQVEAEPREFFVYYLQHGQSDDLAKILGEMLVERERVEQRVFESGVQTAPLPAGNQNNPVVQPINQPIVPAPVQGSQAVPGVLIGPAGNPNIITTPAPFASGAATPGDGSTTPISATRTNVASQKVSADISNNALVFYMTRSEYGIVRKLVEQLDIPRKQVLISAIIAEVSLNRLKQASINWQAVTKSGALIGFGAGQTLENLLSILASGQFVAGGIDPTTVDITIGGTTVQVPRNFVLFQFLNTDSDFNLISSPRLLTHNHKEANIKVGQVTPFATGARFDINGQPIINFDYREVGLDLKLTPHISSEKDIRLELHQKLQEVIRELQQGVGAASFTVPVVSNREVNTEVTLQDGQTLIIGGLIEKRTLQNMRKVPILGDIPLLGDIFFKNQTADTRRTTLFLFITPHIIDSPQKMREVTNQYEKFLPPRMKDDQGEVKRQDYKPLPYTPPPVVDPIRMPTPGPLPTPQGQPAMPPARPSPEPPATGAPRTDAGPQRPDSVWQ
ncbi:MAG: type II secretion system protein GspD [Armatimonadetes bacterium]|nr:type II secretion system protein GspD [Armatimonadota bacterium]